MGTVPSALLLAAQERLLQLRAKVQASQAVSAAVKSSAVTLPPQPEWGSEPLPEHLGWESQRVTAAMRAAAARRQAAAAANLAWLADLKAVPTAVKPAPILPRAQQTVKLYPDIALGILRQEQAGPARVWLLAHHIDKMGQGCLRIDVVRQQLTQKSSPLRLCGWRQLRNLLQQGQGVFWYRDKTHVWLRSAAKVALSLQVARLTGKPVALPVSVLLNGVGEAKAHFYASFHSSRQRNNPISRDTLEQISGVSPPVQRYYEKAARVSKQHNMAVGEVYTTERMHTRAWRHGHAVFAFIDHHGRQGPAGRRYIAWWLPNTYQGSHEQCPKGRQKKINQQIDLVEPRARGNGLQARLFYPDGSQAAKAYLRGNGARDTYWINEHGRKKPFKLWYTNPALEAVSMRLFATPSSMKKGHMAGEVIFTGEEMRSEIY